MKIVIVGNGKVGQTLASLISNEGHDVVVVDSDARKYALDIEKHDVLYLEGNGTSYDVLQAAGVSEADVLVAVTPHDEVNILCCLVARRVGAKHTIARVRDPEIEKQLHHIKEDLGLTRSFNPERNAASEITRILHHPSVLKIESFAGGKIEMVELKIGADSPIVNRPIKDFRIHNLRNFIICAVERGNDIFIPNGDFVVQPGDKVFVSIEAVNLTKLFKGFHLPHNVIRSVLVVGGGRISYYLAKQLLENKMEVTIIEKNVDRCQFLAENLNGAVIKHEDASDERTLESYNFASMDAFVALTNMDEENLVMSLYAAHRGSKKVITKVNRLSYLDAFTDTRIDTVISPKMLISDQILQIVRAMAASGESSVQALYKISGYMQELESGNYAEALEFNVRKDTNHLDVPLKDIKLKDGVLIACISRRGQVIIPKGNDVIKAGDIIILVTKDHIVSSLNEIFV